MKINVIGIGNYFGNFSANNMHSYAQQLRLPETFPDKPAIHVYFHKYGCPLEMNDDGNHFAYLEPISEIMYDSLDNGIQYGHTANIISQELDVIDLEQSPLTISTRSDTVYDNLYHIDTPQIISQESNMI